MPWSFLLQKAGFICKRQDVFVCVRIWNLRFAAPVAEDEVLPQELFVFSKSSLGLRLTEGKYQNPMTAGTDRKGESEK